MTIFSTSAEFATITEGNDLSEISDGRLRFKEGKSGIIIAKFMVTQHTTWLKMRLTYRRPGNGLRLENYVIARFKQIGRLTLESETLNIATSQNHPNDSEEIRSILGVNTLLNEQVFSQFFYHIEIVMRRSPLLVLPPEIVVAEAVPIPDLRTTVDQDHPTTEYDEPTKTKQQKRPRCQSHLRALSSWLQLVRSGNSTRYSIHKLNLVC